MEIQKRDNRIATYLQSQPIGLTKAEAAVARERIGPSVKDYEAKSIQGETDDGFLKGEKYAKALITAYLVKSMKFLGLREKNFPDKETGSMIVDFIFDKHGWIRPAEIFNAFIHAVENDNYLKRNHDKDPILDNYQNIDVKLVNRVLYNYKSVADQIESNIQKKMSWFKTSLRDYRRDRKKDNESIKNIIYSTLEESIKNPQRYEYESMFHSLYDYFDFGGYITLTVEEKKQINAQVKVNKVDSFHPQMGIKEIIKMFYKPNILQECKKVAFKLQLDRWQELEDYPFHDYLKNSCYIGENAFRDLYEIYKKRRGMMNGGSE